MLSKIMNYIREIFHRMVPIKHLNNVFADETIPEMNGFYDNIEYWSDIYRGGGKWRETRKGGIYGGTRKVKALGAAKLVCNELANLIFSEQVEIMLSDSGLQEYVIKVLKDNKFWNNFSSLLENTYALGGGVIKVYADKGAVKLDYVPASRFYPTAWDNRLITGGVFVSKTVRGERYYTLLERHHFENGVETIVTKLFRSVNKSEIGYKVDLSELYEGLQEITAINNISAPTFAYIKPNIANNIDFDNPLGVSVFANAIDTLEALDIAFDSFEREFTLGKKRIIVPTSAIQTEYDENGVARRYFDTSDEVYQALRTEDTESLKITDNSVELRIEQHITGINALLNILSSQIGLSAGSLSFDAVQGIKTATEVISQNSKTYRTVRGHQNIIAGGLEQMVETIISFGTALGNVKTSEYEISMKFDDSIITDKNADIDNVIKLTAGGLMSKKDGVMKVFGYDEETASKKVKELTDESRVSAGMIDYNLIND